MEKIKRVLRVLALVLLIGLASIGMTVTGAAPALPKNREKYLTETEQTEKKEDENEDTELNEEKS